MIRPEHPFDIRPDLRKAESVIRPKQLVRNKTGGLLNFSRLSFLLGIGDHI